MSDRYLWKGKPVSELTGDELLDWLRNREQFFTHSVEIDGMSLSMVNPEVLDGTSINKDGTRQDEKVAG